MFPTYSNHRGARRSAPPSPSPAPVSPSPVPTSPSHRPLHLSQHGLLPHITRPSPHPRHTPPLTSCTTVSTMSVTSAEAMTHPIFRVCPLLPSLTDQWPPCQGGGCGECVRAHWYTMSTRTVRGRPAWSGRRMVQSGNERPGQVGECGECVKVHCSHITLQGERGATPCPSPRGLLGRETDPRAAG